MENVVTNSQVHEYSLMRFFFVPLYISLLLSLTAQGQTTTLSKKNKELLEKGQKAWDARQLEAAGAFYEKILETAPDFAEAHRRLGQIAEWQNKPDQARQHFRKSLSEDVESVSAYQWLAKDALQRELYDSALVYFHKSLQIIPPKSNAARVIENRIASVEFAKKAVQAAFPIVKKSLGDTVNQLKSQSFPVVSPDRRTLIFTGLTPQMDENMYLSEWINGAWGPPKELSSAINTQNNEGTCTLSADGKNLVFTACNRFDGYGDCDLYYSRQTGTTWSVPENLGAVVNSRYWESQPSLSADGRTLYFSSNRPGGLGRHDIWKSQKGSDGKWMKPVNLGASINTPNDEKAPFIHANGNTLFFASDKTPGMGGFDIYLSKLADTTWSSPVNLGYPINTPSDQVGLFITADGRSAYYTDDQISRGQGKSLLYTFELPDTLRKLFTPTHYTKGKITDSQTHQPLAASIELFDLQTGKKISEFESQPSDGEFTVIINKESDYALYVNRSGYLFKSKTFSVSDSVVSARLEIGLEAVRKNQNESLNNIFFRVGDFELDKKSQVELSKLVAFLRNNPTLSIEISGHTDDTGNEKSNLELSRKRAEAVVHFLVSQGIDAKRLNAIGYGQTRPQLPNITEENRKINRRIEWRIR